MPRVLLLQTDQAYSETLATVVTDHFPSFDVDVVSRVPIRDRVRAIGWGDYDLVQADEFMVNGVLATVGSLVRRIPLVVSIRGWADYTNAHGQFGRFKAATIGARTRVGLAQAREIMFISETAFEHFSQHYAVEEATVVNHPVDVNRYANGTPSNRRTFDVLTVTNLRYQQKFEGVKVTLEALEPLFNQHDDLRYRIAGDGQYLSELRAFLADYDHADRVTILGYVDSVEDELASSDAFVYVSFLDSFGAVVLEAQAAGLPVVAGDAVGVPEAVGDAGLLCEPTPVGIRKGLEQLMDADVRNQLSSQSRQKMTTYNEECAAGHVEVWNRALQD